MLFTASATKCPSWLCLALLMLYSPELHNCFFANPSLIYFGGFCFSVDSGWGRYGNHKHHIWRVFMLPMVKITIPSHKSILAWTFFLKLSNSKMITPSTCTLPFQFTVFSPCKTCKILLLKPIPKTITV